VVLPEGCTSSDPPNCGSLRGGQFAINQSSTWVQNNQTANGIFGLVAEDILGYSGNGLYGYDTVGLGYPGSGVPTMDQQVVAGIATDDFYMGIFGLAPPPSNFTDYNHPVPSYMSNMKANNLIPSLSYGYTAGNQYRLNKVFGSLTLGGYDASLFEPNNITWSLYPESEKDLTVNIKNISIWTNERILGNSSSSSDEEIAVFIDSTTPYLWLPKTVCQMFEETLGITYDNQTQLYLVNDTLHNTLLNQAPEVTFTLGNLSSTDTVNITLPYQAFDLTASYPLVQNGTSRYFPLKQASNESQYTLGRVFFQEA
jgi:hypothetical protein